MSVPFRRTRVRFAFPGGGGMSDCIFCKIAAGQIPAKIEYQNEHVVAFRDLNPQAPVHMLVIPRKHIAKISETEAGDLHLVGECIRAANELAVREKLGDGYRLVNNCGARAGQTVWHVHWHLLGGRAMGWPPG